MDPMQGLMGGMAGGPPGGGQPAPGATPPGLPKSPNPNDILQQMLGQPFPPLPGRMKKGKKLVAKDENKNTTPGTPSGKLQKARDMVKAVVNELGAQNDIASALSGIVRNLDMQIKKIGGADVTENQITGQGDMGKPPLGVGTPGTSPPEGAGMVASPVNPDTLTQNLQGGMGGNF
jgi:hypothetical protein